jgi:DNA topoisomerase-1
VTTTLIISEKPDAARRIAEALSNGSQVLSHSRKGIPVYEIVKPKDRIIVCSALGHLYSVDQKTGTGRKTFPVWDLTWKPRHLVERDSSRLRTFIEQIREVSSRADRFVNACDYDIEGSLIGATVLRYACDGADRSAKRMKFSTLTSAELREAYANLMDTSDMPLVNAGACRHEVDWTYGVNLSRVLTNSAHQYGGAYSTLSTGRVQGPTLRFVVDREKEISCFVPTPYWSIDATVAVNGSLIPAQYEKETIDSKGEAEKVVRDCSAKSGEITDIDSQTSKLLPPTPFDLSTLQAEAYRHLGLRPSHALGIAERLYLDALISYPRTSSQKLPLSIEYRKILENLSALQAYRPKIEEILKLASLSPHEGAKTDPAHPAIYPTGNIPSRPLEQREQKIYDLVIRRFMATFGAVATRRSEKATVLINEHCFYLRGTRILEKGWMSLYEPYVRLEEVLLPPLKVGDAARIVHIADRDKFTQPPPRYNPSSLQRAMENHNIGTKATRAETVETLYRRGYVTGERMTPTPLALSLVEVLRAHCPKVIDIDFTRELEGKMEDIEAGRNNRERVLIEAIDQLRAVMAGLRVKASELGTELGNTIRETRSTQISFISPCPKCGSKLTVVRNRKTGKRFIGCTGRWTNNCTFSLPLPQKGMLTLLRKFCSKCGFQLVQTKASSSRPMVSCSKCFSERNRTEARALVETTGNHQPMLTRQDGSK